MPVTMKKQTKMTKITNMTNKLTEGLGHDDLKGLINDNVLIDLHKPKIGDEADTVVVAFQVTYEDPAKDLSQFIETGAFDRDIIDSRYEYRKKYPADRPQKGPTA